MWNLYPLLDDFVIQNTLDNMNHIDYAIKLRENRHAVVYKNI